MVLPVRSLVGALAAAGFRDIESKTFSAPLKMQSAAECVRFEQESFGALHEMMTPMSEGERNDTWSEIHDALRQFESPTGFEGPCEILIGAGAK